MKSRNKIEGILKDNGIDSITIVLILIVILLICLSIGINSKVVPFATYPNKTSSQKVSKALMKQSLNNVITDRMRYHESRLPITPTTQYIAQSEGKKAYRNIPTKIRRTYQSHMLYTNDRTEKTPVTKELIKASKNVNGISYHSNVTTVSFGNQHYTKAQQQWHPWHNVKTSHKMSSLINKRMMQQIKHNSHRENILNKNNQSIGIYAKYNKKLNRGVLVETFRKKES